METIKELMRGRTTLIVTHRLATIHNVDQIVVLEHGRIVEQGRGAELVAKGGVYAKLYASGYYPSGAMSIASGALKTIGGRNRSRPMCSSATASIARAPKSF